MPRRWARAPSRSPFEELYLALQQGTVDGQENPINNIAANNIHEVQDVISLSSHQLNSNLVVINEAKWQRLSPEQQAALTAAVDKAMARCPGLRRGVRDHDPRGLAREQHDRDRRGRRSRRVPDQGRGLPPRELHAGAGHGPRGHPLGGAVDRPTPAAVRPRALHPSDIPPPLAWRQSRAALKGVPADDGPGGSAGRRPDPRAAA